MQISTSVLKDKGIYLVFVGLTTSNTAQNNKKAKSLSASEGQNTQILKQKKNSLIFSPNTFLSNNSIGLRHNSQQTRTLWAGDGEDLLINGDGRFIHQSSINMTTKGVGRDEHGLRERIMKKATERGRKWRGER